MAILTLWHKAHAIVQPNATENSNWKFLLSSMGKGLQNVVLSYPVTYFGDLIICSVLEPARINQPDPRKENMNIFIVIAGVTTNSTAWQRLSVIKMFVYVN